MPTVQTASREQVLAFRLDGHGLNRRQPAGSLVEAAARCGIRNTPPGAAVLAAHARIEGASSAMIERAVEDKALVEVIGMRISPVLVPRQDVAVFTLGALPGDEDSLRSVMGSPNQGSSLTEALELATAAAADVLDGRLLDRGSLSAAITQRLPASFALFCRACNSRHVQESLFRLIGARGVFVIAARPDKRSIYARTDQWLGHPLEADRAAARHALLRRFLRCYGPSTAAHFAGWTGISVADAQESWDEITCDLVPVAFAGRRTWLYAEDFGRLEHPPAPKGVRLLPPYDAYLDQRDRETIVPDRTLHRRVWKILGNPGAVLAAGEIVGLWRPRKKGKRLIVNVEPFTPLPVETRDEIAAEAASLAPLRGCTVAEVEFDG